MNLISLSISMVEENTSMWITPQHLLVLSHGGQISSCVIEQPGADALSRSRCSPADTYCFKTFMRRSNRAQNTKHRDSSDMAQALRCGHEG